MNAFIVSTLVFQFVNGAANVPAHPYHPSIADLANFEHTFCKKEQTTAEKDILSKKRMQSFPACAILIDNFREFSHRDEKE
ncbi:MAG TPA: hypothetical protein DCR92_08925 [Faecalibacterium sp.]|jgi:hypothetical protein|nr:hypothetical protein [Faecalibacterium prausnitzii]HAQ97343.1 hypothetical protein [Faecalibacterium sp.]